MRRTITTLCLSSLLAACLAGSIAPAQEERLAQNKVKTETIRPPAPGEQKFRNEGHVVAPGDTGKFPEVITNPARLPPAVARTRERILAAARSGELLKLFAVMKEAPTLPVFSFSEDNDPVSFWKTNYPDSDGVEALSILVNVLEIETRRKSNRRPTHAAFEVSREVLRGRIYRIRIFRIVAGDLVQHQGVVFDGARDGTDVVEAPG